MVKKFLIIIAFVTVAFGSSVDEKVMEFMGKERYESQKNLINILFADRDSFMSGDKVDSLAVLKKLKENGLLRLIYPEVKSVEISFSSKDNAVAFMRLINESLQAMGYTYFLTHKLEKSNDGAVWIVNMNTQHLVDPILLVAQIDSRGGEVLDISKISDGVWGYEVQIVADSLKPYPIGENAHLGNPIKPYLINISTATRATIRANSADRWFPRVVFLDKNFGLIEEIGSTKSESILRLNIPKNAQYMQIEDKYSLDNIKRGLSLHLQER